MNAALSLLARFIVGHAFADFVLQSGDMAKYKNRHNQAAWIPPGQTKQTVWPYFLTAHALMHGAVVYFITGSLIFGALEAAAHWSIDFGKCESWYGIHGDQSLHLACKVFYTVLIYAVL